MHKFIVTCTTFDVKDKTKTYKLLCKANSSIEAKYSMIKWLVQSENPPSIFTIDSVKPL